MAYTDTANMPLHMPTPGSREPAQIALLNENCVVLSTHDHTAGKGLAAGRLRSGLQASRPAASSAGGVYFATDTGKFYVDTGTAWVEFITSGSAITATGWTLIDPIIRDTLQFAPEPTGAVDATITRTGAGALRVDTHLGVGVNPAVWRSDLRAIQVGAGMFLQGYATGASYNAYLGSNSYQDDTGLHAIVAGEGVRLGFVNGAYQFYTAPSVAAGALQTFTLNLTVNPTGQLIVNAAGANEALVSVVTAGAGNANLVFTNNGAQRYGIFAGTAGFSIYDYPKAANRLGLSTVGTFNVTPDPTQWGITQTGGHRIAANTGLSPADANVSFYSNDGSKTAYIGMNSLNGLAIGANTGTITFYASTSYVQASSDNYQNLGGSGTRWIAVYAVAGAINTSTYEAKEAFSPLDPALCAQAVVETDWVNFAYKPSQYQEPEQRPGDEPEVRSQMVEESRTAHAKAVQETAHTRKQKGYVLNSPVHKTHDLFGLEDRQSASPGSDLAVVACALQDALRRLAVLEGVDAPAS